MVQGLGMVAGRIIILLLRDMIPGWRIRGVGVCSRIRVIDRSSRVMRQGLGRGGRGTSIEVEGGI